MSEQKEDVFDEIAGLGKKYELLTSRFMVLIGSKPVGDKITRDSIMRELIGTDYDTMSEKTQNIIFTTLIKPDLETAVEDGLLKEIAEEEYEKAE